MHGYVRERGWRRKVWWCTVEGVVEWERKDKVEKDLEQVLVE